jgi:Flp pilus assembly protein TadD
MRLSCLLVWPLILFQASSALSQENLDRNLYERAADLARAGNLNEALRELHKAAEHTPNDPKVHNMLGVVLTELGRLDEANEAYNRALSLAPDFFPARKNRAINGFTRGDFNFAAAEFGALAQLQPNDFVPHLFLGLLALKVSNFPMARKHLLVARRLSPENVRVLLALAKVHFALGERPLALDLAREMRTTSRDNPERFNLGVLLAQFEANTEAAEIFQELWGEKPTYDVGFNLALCLYRLGQLEAALQTVQELNSRVKPSGELLSLQGWIYNKMRRLNQARQSLESAIAAEPGNPDHYLDLSTVLNNQGESEAALQVLTAGMDRGVEKRRLQVQKGMIYEKTGNYVEAEKFYRAAVEAKAADPPAYVALAALLLGTDRQKEALGLLRNATQLFPNAPLLQYMYGAELLESTREPDQEQLENAESVLKKALELNPFYANTHYMLGRLYLKRQDDNRAQTCFEKACAFNPKHTDAYYQSLRIAVRLGEKDKAAKLDKIVRKLHDEEKGKIQDTVTGVVEESLRGLAEGAIAVKSAN